jgi:hypothetical protein
MTGERNIKPHKVSQSGVASAELFGKQENESEWERRNKEAAGKRAAISGLKPSVCT